jgi:hypothetical protein
MRLQRRMYVNLLISLDLSLCVSYRFDIAPTSDNWQPHSLFMVLSICLCCFKSVNNFALSQQLVRVSAKQTI